MTSKQKIKENVKLAKFIGLTFDKEKNRWLSETDFRGSWEQLQKVSQLSDEICIAYSAHDFDKTLSNPDDNFEDIHPDEFLLFDSDWNWIMVIVDKIEELGYFCGINKTWATVYSGQLGKQVIQISTVEGNTKILNTWKACLIFVEWFNKQQKHDSN